VKSLCMISSINPSQETKRLARMANELSTSYIESQTVPVTMTRGIFRIPWIRDREFRQLP